MKWLLCLCLSLLLVAGGTRAFNIEVYDGNGSLLIMTHLDVGNDTEYDEDYSGSGDDEEGSAGDLIWDWEGGEEDEEEPEHAWQFDEVVRRFNHLEPIYPHSLAIPLNFPTRAGRADTSPPDRIYPIVGSEFVLSFPNCSRYQTSYNPIAEDASFHPRNIHFIPTPHNQSLTLKLQHISEDLFLKVSVACLDITVRGKVFHLNDPEVTYVLLFRPNFQDLHWFVKTDAAPGSDQEFHPYINVTYEADVSWWNEPETFWMPLNLPLNGSLPDQPIPLRLGQSLNFTLRQCPEHVMLLHPFRPYRSPNGRVQVFPVPGRNDSYYYGFYDVTVGSSAIYMSICCSASPEWHDRYSVIRPNFRNMKFSASSLPFYDLPVQIYPDLRLWREPNWAFVHETRNDPVFPVAEHSNYTLLNVSVPAGLSGYRITFTMDQLLFPINLTRGVNPLPDYGQVDLDVNYDGHWLSFTLLNLTESAWGSYDIYIFYHNGTSRLGWIHRLIFLRPHLRPSFFNPDVRAPYTHRFQMPWRRPAPITPAPLQLAQARADPTPVPAHEPDRATIGIQFFVLACAIAVLCLSVLAAVLVKNYVKPPIQPFPQALTVEESHLLGESRV